MAGATAFGGCSQSMGDVEIIAAYRAKRHATCFQLLYDRYAAKIYSKAISILKKESEAEDATQEIFTKIFLNLGKFEGQSKFSTWVYSITYNFCIDRVRKGKKSRELFAPELDNPPDLEADEVPDQELMHMQLNELRHVLNALPDADRTILLMKYKDGVKISAISVMLGKTESAVKMQLKRAKEKAKRIHERDFPNRG